MTVYKQKQKFAYLVLILSVIAFILICTAVNLTYETENPKSSIIVEKYIEPEKYIAQPIIIGKLVATRAVFIPKQFILNIEYRYEKYNKYSEVKVSEEIYNSVEIGDNY